MKLLLELLQCTWEICLEKRRSAADSSGSLDYNKLGLYSRRRTQSQMTPVEPVDEDDGDGGGRLRGGIVGPFGGFRHCPESLDQGATA